jgi:hypothetical protein
MSTSKQSLRFFGSKCFILNKKPKSSKFAPKVDKGFLLGYASNAHGYGVFNNSSGYIKIACDVTFDEYNGSQKEQVDLNDADDEIPSQQAIENLAIGEIIPQEKNDQEASKGGPNTVAAKDSGDASEEALEKDKEDEDDDLVQHQAQTPHPRVQQSIQHDHPMDNIRGSIQRGVTSHSWLAIFCEYYSFSLEPLKVEEAFGDGHARGVEQLHSE